MRIFSCNSITDVLQPALDTFFEDVDTFLNSNVKNGQVAYEAINENPEQLIALVKHISDISLYGTSPAERKDGFLK